MSCWRVLLFPGLSCARLQRVTRGALSRGEWGLLQCLPSRGLGGVLPNGLQEQFRGPEALEWAHTPLRARRRRPRRELAAGFQGARALASRQLSAWRESPAVPAPCGRDHPCCQPRAGGPVHGAERRSGRPGPHGRVPPLPSAAPGNDPVRTASLGFAPLLCPAARCLPKPVQPGRQGDSGVECVSAPAGEAPGPRWASLILTPCAVAGGCALRSHRHRPVCLPFWVRELGCCEGQSSSGSYMGVSVLHRQ